MTWTEANRAAWGLLREGRLEAAVQQWSAMAEALCEQGRGWEARGVGRTLVSITEGAPWSLRSVALVVMAEANRSVGELAEAASWARRALKLHEAEGNAAARGRSWVLLGELAEESGDLVEAIACWDRALELLDGEPETDVVQELLLHLGGAHSALGNRARAHECAARAQRLSAPWVA